MAGLTISPATFPNGIVGVAFSQQMTSTGTAPKTWSVFLGSLPPGLTLNTSSGLISGTPSVHGSYNFTLKVIDSLSQQGTRNYNPVLEVDSNCSQYYSCSLNMLSMEDIFKALIKTDSNGCPSLNTIRS